MRRPPPPPDRNEGAVLVVGWAFVALVAAAVGFACRSAALDSGPARVAEITPTEDADNYGDCIPHGDTGCP
jgi:hypothetical protein